MAASLDPSTHLFPASLLPAQSTSPPPTSSSTSSAGTPFSLPEGYSIRPLAREDHASGVLEVLAVLTTVGDISAERWLERFDHMRRGFEHGGIGTYYVLVVCDAEGKVVGTGSVVVERKL